MARDPIIPIPIAGPIAPKPIAIALARTAIHNKLYIKDVKALDRTAIPSIHILVISLIVFVHILVVTLCQQFLVNRE